MEGSPPMQRPRLFLSYGRRDAALLAARLCTDLEALGFEVWQDTHRIRPGQAWEDEIKDGLRSAQVVVALLTPHAVRRSVDPDNPDNTDSVCLDEISFARFAHPPKPILPIMATPCEPPFCIFRLDYTDMTQWRESEDQYRIGLDRLVTRLEAVVHGDPPALRSWDDWLVPLDFTPYLYEKRQDFVGRQWLLDLVDQWRTGNTRERALLITGDPGSGKSAFVAEMVHRNRGGHLLAYHCCIADEKPTRDPGMFVRSLAAMIASRLPEYAEQLQAGRLKDSLENALNDPVQALDEGILAPLECLPAPEGAPRLILVDGLDEALLLSGRELSIVKLLAMRLERFPAWLRVVATTRREVEVLDRLSGLRAASIDSQTEDSDADITAFVNARLASPGLATWMEANNVSAADLHQRLQRAGAGNFLYVRTVLQDIERGHYARGDLDAFPQGLSGIYKAFFERRFSSAEQYRMPRAALEVVLAAQEPVTFAMLAQASGLDGEYDLPEVLSNLSSFVQDRDGRYALYHKSLADWLTDARCPYRVSVKKGHEQLAGLFLKSIAERSGTGPTARPDGSEHDAEYWRTYGLTHLARAHRVLPSDVTPEVFWSFCCPAIRVVPSIDDQTREVPRFASEYVDCLIERHDAENLLLLVRSMAESARRRYGAAQRIRRSLYDEVSQAVYASLTMGGWAGAITRAFCRSAGSLASPGLIRAMQNEISSLEDIGNHLDITCWTRSTFLEDSGACLADALKELRRDAQVDSRN